MAYAPQTLPSSLYRPRKIPRVLRRQLPVVRILGIILFVGLLAIAITWRNLNHERLSLDVGRQRVQIETLNKEIKQLDGQIETESSYARVSKWVLAHHGRWMRTDHVGTITLSESALSPIARDEAKLLGVTSHE
jgi:cell division protein FtsL